MEKIKELIINCINEHTGIKGVDLVVDVCSNEVNTEEYENALNELVMNGEIIEVEYTLPSMDYRVKSMYFPKETVVVVSGQ